MVTQDDFLQICEKVGLGAFTSHLSTLVRVGVFGISTGREHAASYVGGLPELSRLHWPVIADAPAKFLGLIDCSELSCASPPAIAIPSLGSLLFFATGGYDLWEEPKLGNGVVLYRPEAVKAAAGSDARPIELKQSVTLPPQEPSIGSIGGPDWSGDKYFQLTDRLRQRNHCLVQCFGIPDPLQDVMEPELCELAGDLDWVLLARFDGTTRRIGPWFGCYYFWIPAADLRAARWNRVIMLFQV